MLDHSSLGASHSSGASLAVPLLGAGRNTLLSASAGAGRNTLLSASGSSSASNLWGLGSVRSGRGSVVHLQTPLVGDISGGGLGVDFVDMAVSYDLGAFGEDQKIPSIMVEEADR